MNRKDINLLSESYKKVHEAYETFDRGWGKHFDVKDEGEQDEPAGNELLSILEDLLNELEYSEIKMDAELAVEFANMFYDIAKGRKVLNLRHARRLLDQAEGTGEDKRQASIDTHLKANNEMDAKVKQLKKGDVITVQLHEGPRPVLKKAVFQKRWDKINLYVKVEGEPKPRIVSIHQVKDIHPKNIQPALPQDTHNQDMMSQDDN
jgi:hypothetical protein